MLPVALAFAVLEGGYSASVLGQVVACYSAALLIFLVAGGIIADRFPRSNVLRVSFASTAALQALLAYLFIRELAEPLQMASVVFATGAVSAFTLPAMQGIVPQLVDADSLQEANVLVSFSRSAAMVLAPIFVGLVAGSAGAGWAVLAGAMTWLVGFAAIARLHIPEPSKSAATIMDDLRHGWSEFICRRWLVTVTVVFSIVNAIRIGAWIVLGPVLSKAHDAIGLTGWSYILTAEAVGVVATAIVLLKYEISRPLLLGLAGLSVLAAPLALLSLGAPIWALCLAAFCAGAGTELSLTGWQVAMMENVPQHALSRVSSYDMLGSYLAIPIGSFFFGWIVAFVPPERVVMWAALTYALACTAALTSREVRTLGRRTIRSTPEHASPGLP